MQYIAMVGGEAEGDGSAVGMPEDDGLMQLQDCQKAADVLGGGAKTRVDVVAALGMSGAGEVESNDVLVGVDLFDQGNEGLRAAHEAVQQNKRGLILRRLSPFEV